MVAHEYLVVAFDDRPSQSGGRIVESFPTEAEASSRMEILGTEARDKRPTFRLWKTNPQRVRKRQSYRLWERLQAFLARDHSIREILEFIEQVLDEQRAFGSETNAWYAKESLFFFLKDLNDQDGVDCFVCKVQDKVRELDESQLQEISDLCMSELDRREESIPSVKEEVGP